MQPGNGNVSKWQELRTSLSCDVSIYRWMYSLQSLHLFWSPCECSLANASNIWCARSFLLQERYIYVCIILQSMYIYTLQNIATTDRDEGTKDHVRNHAMTVEDSGRFMKIQHLVSNEVYQPIPNQSLPTLAPRSLNWWHVLVSMEFGFSRAIGRLSYRQAADCWTRYLTRNHSIHRKILKLIDSW